MARLRRQAPLLRCLSRRLAETAAEARLGQHAGKRSPQETRARPKERQAVGRLQAKLARSCSLVKTAALLPTA